MSTETKTLGMSWFVGVDGNAILILLLRSYIVHTKTNKGINMGVGRVHGRKPWLLSWLVGVRGWAVGSVWATGVHDHGSGRLFVRGCMEVVWSLFLRSIVAINCLQYKFAVIVQ
jgi:hypothetical protein